MISIEVAVSSAPVGSSARISFGRVISARAIATRCCCPPDISRRQVVGPGAQPDALEVLSGERVALAARHALVVERQRDVFERGLEGDQVERLEDEADERFR